MFYKNYWIEVWLLQSSQKNFSFKLLKYFIANSKMWSILKIPDAGNEKFRIISKKLVFDVCGWIARLNCQVDIVK